jgi:lysine 6-dehydrogenase
MKYTVIGAGMMGSAVAYDLAINPHDEIILADVNLEAASKAAKNIGANVRSLQLDVQNETDLTRAISDSNVIVSAVSFAVNYTVTKAAIDAHVHMCDLGGNNDVVLKQLALDAAAKESGITIVPNCGLAPGLVNILAMEGTKEFDVLDAIRLRVGGLPQHPQPPLNYQIVFSAEGLLNEYMERATVIRDGDLMQIDSMSDIEEITLSLPFGDLEAFSTSGGLSTLATVLNGKVKNLDYKTIRYKGHCEKFKTLLDLGFASSEPIIIGGRVSTSREFFANLLRSKLDYGDTDVVLARVTVTGRKGPTWKTLVYELVDYYDDATKMTAMMRTTAFPTSIIAQMLARGVIRERGVLPPERCVPGEALIQELSKRNIKITRNVTETRS